MRTGLTRAEELLTNIQSALWRLLMAVLFCLQLGFGAGNGQAAVANDRFNNAQVITGATGTVAGSNAGANKEPGEPDHAGNAGGSSIWYRWTAPSSGPYSFNTAGSTFDTLLAVYTGSSVGALSAVATNDDYANELTSEAGFTAVSGMAYSIVIDGYDNETGGVTLNWLLESPPMNDRFTNRLVISGNSGSLTSSNSGAGKEPGEPDHAGEPGGRSVWFSWTAPSAGEFIFNTGGSEITALLAIYTGTGVSALTLVASNDLYSTPDNVATVTAVAGTTYAIAVDGYFRHAGMFALQWSKLSDDTMKGTLQTVHAFTNGNDGGSPFAGVTVEGDTLYGGSLAGAGYGNLYKVRTDGSGYVVLHQFLNFNAGAHPYAPPLLSGGLLYGTTRSGGQFGNGTVFAVRTNGTGYTNLHHFAAGTLFPKTNIDGALPQAGLVLAGNRLYGTTTTGGNAANGTVYVLNTNGTGFTVLHHFSTMSGSPGTNEEGANPHAGLVLAGSTLYGSALNGGPFGYGTIFAMNTNGSEFRTLHAFAWSFDGAWPRNLSLEGGRLYGAGSGGGLYGNGSVFAVKTNGALFTNLFSFANVEGATFTNKFGANPFGGVMLQNQRIHATTAGGGIGGRGTVLSMNTNGTDIWVLHSFTAGAGPSRTNYDGGRPRSTLAASGNDLYGTTEAGGELAWGTVFRITMGTDAPRLAVARSNNEVVITWPEGPAFSLEATASLGQSNTWTNVTQSATTNAGTITVTVPTTTAAGFFRLKSP